MELILTIITILYAGTGVIAAIGYIPTINDLYKKINSANIQSYAIWTFSSMIAFLYAWLIISDLLLEIVTGVNLLFCSIIFILAVKLKYKK